jgi:hypothetical protein
MGSGGDDTLVRRKGSKAVAIPTAAAGKKGKRLTVG